MIHSIDSSFIIFFDWEKRIQIQFILILVFIQITDFCQFFISFFYY